MLLFQALLLAHILWGQRFTEVPHFNAFVDAGKGAVTTADMNGDHHPDILVVGQLNSDERIAKLYINNGKGSFTEVADMPFTGVSYGSIAIGDVNGDRRPDVFLTGYDGSAKITRLYLNNE